MRFRSLLTVEKWFNALRATEAQTLDRSESKKVNPILMAIAGLALFAGTAYAQQEWDADHPWWCYQQAEACGKYSSPTTYIGPTYTDCYALIFTGWANWTTVNEVCATN